MNNEDLAGSLAKLLGTQEMFIAYLRQCTAPSSGFDPAYEFKMNPGYFGGISPQSAYWPEIEALYGRYQQRMCSYITPDDFSGFFAGYYGKTLSKEELRAAIDFYSSPGGKKLSLANQAANEAFQTFAQGKMRELYRSTYVETSEDVAAVIRKYRKEPK